MRNVPLKGFMKKSPIKQQDSTAVRTDSTERYDPVTLEVDSTPVGNTKVKAGGYGFSAAVASGNKNASMWKSKRDKTATIKAQELNKSKSSASKPGSGGMTPIMPE